MAIVFPTNHAQVLSTASPQCLNLELWEEMMFSEAYETFEQHKEEWLAEHWGEYVVIEAYHVLGFFPSFGQAYDAGRRHYGPGVFFLVMRVLDYDQLAVYLEPR